MARTAHFSLLALAWLLTACPPPDVVDAGGDGEDPSGGGSSDGGSPEDAGTVDGGPDGRCDYQGFTVAGSDYLTTALGDFVLLYDGPLDDEIGKVQIELYTGMREPGTLPITDANFADCTVCVSILASCVDQGDGCEAHFLARAGTLELTTYDDTTAAGRLSGVEAVQVTIDPDTAVSTVVEPVIGWCLDELVFEAVLPD